MSVRLQDREREPRGRVASMERGGGGGGGGRKRRGFLPPGRPHRSPFCAQSRPPRAGSRPMSAPAASEPLRYDRGARRGNTPTSLSLLLSLLLLLSLSCSRSRSRSLALPPIATRVGTARECVWATQGGGGGGGGEEGKRRGPLLLPRPLPGRTTPPRVPPPPRARPVPPAPAVSGFVRGSPRGGALSFSLSL